MHTEYSIKLRINEKSRDINYLTYIKGFKLNKDYKFQLDCRTYRPNIRLSTKDNPDCTTLFYDSMDEVANDWNPSYPRLANIRIFFISKFYQIIGDIKRLIRRR